MLKSAFSILLAAIISINSGLLYGAQPLDLSLLLEEAQKNNPAILSAQKRWIASKARIPQEKSMDDPAIGLKFEKAKGSPFRLDTTPAMDRMLSVSQMFPWFGKLTLKGKIALVESQMYAAELKNKELDITNKVKNAYFDLFMNYKEKELKEEGLVFLENISRITDTRYVIEGSYQEGIYKINLEIAKLNNDISNLGWERISKEARLNSLLNREPESPLGVPYIEEGALEFKMEPTSLYILTLENQQELLIFSYAIERNRYAKDLAKKSFLPDLMAGVVMRGLASGGSVGPWDLMLAFTVPLWFWTKQRYEIKEAIANVEEAEAAYQSMKNKALAETKVLATKVEISLNKIKLYKNNQIPLLENYIEYLFSSYRSGKGDIMALLDSQRILTDTKLDYYKALVEYNMNLSDLEKNIGVDLRKAGE